MGHRAIAESSLPVDPPQDQPSPSPPLVGAPSTIATDDADMLSALSAGMSLLNQQSNSLYLHMPVRVVQASRQVVSGMKYTIQIEMGESSCLKDFAGELTLDACPVSGSTQRYELSIWDQPWMDPRYHLTEHRAIAESSLPVDPPQDQPSPSPPLAGAPVLAVPAAAYYGYKHKVHQANRDATVTVSEESAQLSSPTARRIEEGIKADIGPAYTQVPKAASDQL